MVIQLQLLHLLAAAPRLEASDSQRTAAGLTSALDQATSASPDPEKFAQLATVFTNDGGFIFSKANAGFNTGLLAIVFAGFMLHIAIEFWKFEPRLDFKPHLIRWFVFSLLILGYKPIAQTISGFVMSLGAVNGEAASVGGDNVKSFLAQQKFKFDEARTEMEAQVKQADDLAQQKRQEEISRADGFLAKAAILERNRETDEANEEAADSKALLSTELGAAFDSGLSSLVFHLMRLVTEGSFTFAAVVLTFLKLLQGAMMKVLFSVGPFMIAFASWPGVTSRYLASWLSALIETAAWGVVAKIFLALMVVNVTSNSRAGDVADPNFFSYIGLNILYAASLLSVPAITSSILRGSAGAGVTAAGTLAAATSAAQSGARMASSAARNGAGRAGVAGAGAGSGRSDNEAAQTDPADPSDGAAAAKAAADRAFHAKKGAIAAHRRTLG